MPRDQLLGGGKTRLNDVNTYREYIGEAGYRYRAVSEFVKSLCGEIKLVYLPPYTPQLNPIEIQWMALKEMLAGRYFESTDGLVGAITDLIDSG